MPTGYTAKLMSEGQPFNEFAMQCARAMGATIMMRDEPLDAPIPEFEPSDHHAKRCEEAKAELELLLNLTEPGKVAFGDQRKEERIAHCEKYLAENQAENARLDAMREQVNAWVPPTPDHEGLKDFMLSQLLVSANHPGYHESELADATAKPAIEWYNDAVKEARGRIEYYTKEDEAERVRTVSRNNWVRALRASLA